MPLSWNVFFLNTIVHLFQFIRTFLKVSRRTGEHVKGGGHWGHCKPDCPGVAPEPEPASNR